MIPYQVDPSLHPDRPKPPQLDDGFSPPDRHAAVPEPLRQQGAGTADATMPAKGES